MEIVDLSDNLADPIRSAIESQPGIEAGTRLRRVIVLTEWVDSDNARWIGGFSDCSPWEGEGILRYALRQGLHFSGDDDCECPDCDED